ncbi:aspartate 1-decarboxylase [Helicobacter sp.]|uniref:aspartate 1-decarboxylase n=1 Tax=Helicobacter sp. TaxID=218 RepID=UPI0025C196FA|nr:aspartate 1-decarboxylase [Helicobacter sp.]MCI5633571.1 aspartate 1-decarboxylase [Helicobacter sp.]MDY5556279.1 aspartate 1-decarboxylase [Helicobacter sp.]
MNLTMLYSKIHRASVSDANLNYVGSITIDSALMQAAGLIEGQKVDIVNINNGERFSTYVITGKSGDMCLNGAAARKVQVGDKIIVMAYAQFSQEELKNYEPKVVLVDEKNAIVAIKKELGNV